MEGMFACDSCGQEFPTAKMKEAFREEGRERIKDELCPSCLDKRMNEAAEVKGVVGEEKAAAVRLTDGSADPSAGEHESSPQTATGPGSGKRAVTARKS